MGNPFKKITKNSEETKKKWDSEKVASEVSSKKCTGCGAPRPKNTNLTTCDYCGLKFMDINDVIKPDV